MSFAVVTWKWEIPCSSSAVQNNQRATFRCSAEMLCHININVNWLGLKMYNLQFWIISYIYTITCLVALASFQEAWNSSEYCHIAIFCCSKLFKKYATSLCHLLLLLEIGKFHSYSAVQNNQRASSHCSAEMLCHINITIKLARTENG